MQGSAEFRVSEEVASEGLLAARLANGTDGTLFDMGSPSLREAAAARIAAHRSKRAGAQAMDAAREEALREEQARIARESRRGAAKVRDAVRARYEQTPSYREFLAAEAERAMQQARAEAEIAARNAKAIADAQMQLLEELREQESMFQAPQPSLVTFEQPRIEAATAAWDDAEFAVFEENRADSQPTPAMQPGDLFAEPEAELTEISTGGLTVRLYEDVAPLPPTPRTAFPATPARSALTDPHAPGMVLESEELEELEHLEQEIAFRRAPEFEDHIIETLPLPANLIEFPRELVAPRKARPRLAEGPLREELAAEPQLRIFEVEPEQISIAPAAPEEAAPEAPVWQGLMLDAAPVRAPRTSQQVAAASLTDIAPISRRLLSATVDACCVGLAMIGFWTVAAWISGPRLTMMSRPMLAGAVFVTLAIAAILYQVLFFSLNEATPGMRYARIALCTFADETPTRRAMRRRLLAMLMAVCPLGLGLLWAWMDDDRLAWHDRISRMYQRMY